MKHSRFPEDQIIGILKEHEAMFQFEFTDMGGAAGPRLQS